MPELDVEKVTIKPSNAKNAIKVQVGDSTHLFEVGYSPVSEDLEGTNTVQLEGVDYNGNGSIKPGYMDGSLLEAAKRAVEDETNYLVDQ
jgi:hypothetical protein